jgi:hypothetical protein
MKMTYETDVLKGENGDLLSILKEMQAAVSEAVQKGTPLHEVERIVWRQVLLMGRAALGQFLTCLGTGDLGESVTLPDGRVCQRLQELHSRRYVSIFGEFRLKRKVYGSREGQKIEFVPLDNRLQLPESVFSYLLQDWDQSLCVEEAFSQAKSTVARMLGFQQSVDSLERMNVQMAESVEAFRAERTLPAAEEEGEIVVSSADGKGVVMRRAEGEAARPAHRTKGDKASRKEMAIVGAVYTVDRYVRTPAEVVAALFGEDRDPRPKRERPKPCHKQTMASLAYTDSEGTHSGIEATYLWMMEEIWARNRGFVKEMVHLCDGQEALWDARECHLPQGNTNVVGAQGPFPWKHARECHLPQGNTTNILDLLHVTPRLWQAAHVFYAEKSDEAEQFVRERVLKVLEGQGELVIRGLRQMGTKRKLTGSKKATLTKVCTYLENNLERMRYDVYLAKGYPIASGVIEGACRHLVKDRMERAGMHWTRTGAQAMLDVRSIHVNGDWDQYQTFRIKRETKKLYPWQEVVDGEKYRQAA